MLAILQTFDPPGVCARNLTECLAIQLKERDRFDPAMQALVEHLDLLAKRDFAALRKLCGVNDEDLADMIAEIRNLNPKPGLAFGSTTVQPIVPDVFVRPAPDGTWQVELNSDTLPKVLVNQRYYAQVSKTTRSDKDKAYLADCLQTATWLVRALDQRAKTILKVSSEIVRQQDAFFAHGVQHLRPLNLKTVADAIGMHESTVSRVTANKYMATSRGIFELKYFFTSSIAAADGGEAHSAEAVRHRIRQLIDAETAADVSVRRHDRRQVARGRHRHRAPHRRQIPRSHADSVLGAAPARKAGGAAILNRCTWSCALTFSAARLLAEMTDPMPRRSAEAARKQHHVISRFGKKHRRRRGAARSASTSGSTRRRRNISTAAIPATPPSARKVSAFAPNARFI